MVWLVREACPPVWGQALIAAAAILLGIPICARAAKSLGKVDPGQIVYDEIAAFAVVFVVAPLTWTNVVAGFLWFRLFDIVKPWPVSRLERLPGGAGVMADDLAAAAYAAVATWATSRLIELVV